MVFLDNPQQQFTCAPMHFYKSQSQCDSKHYVAHAIEFEHIILTPQDRISHFWNLRILNRRSAVHDVTPTQRPAMETALVNKAAMGSGGRFALKSYELEEQIAKEICYEREQGKTTENCSLFIFRYNTRNLTTDRRNLFSKDVPVSIVHWVCSVHQHAL